MIQEDARGFFATAGILIKKKQGCAYLFGCEQVLEGGSGFVLRLICVLPLPVSGGVWRDGWASWMALELVDGDVGVYLGGVEVGMAEHGFAGSVCRRCPLTCGWYRHGAADA